MMGPFVNSLHLLDIVHFQDLRLTFKRTDPYLYFDTSYDAFGLSFPWLQNSDSYYSILTLWIGAETDQNSLFSLGYACCSVKTYDFVNPIENHIHLPFL